MQLVFMGAIFILLIIAIAEFLYILSLKSNIRNIAHDLRTPLAAISGYLELMESVPTDEKGHRYLAVIRERTEALKRLTEELFQYSVITSACDELKPTSLSLNSELEIALAGAYGMLSARGIVPEIHMPERDVKRALDHTALQRVFGNIFANTAIFEKNIRRKCEKNTVESVRHVHHWPVRGNTIPIIGHIHAKPGRDILTDGSVDPFGHLDFHLQ